RYRHTPLELAMNARKPAIVKRLVQQGASVNVYDKNGIHALIWAIERHEIALANVIIDRTQDVDVRNEKGETPLVISIKLGENNLAIKLLQRGADTQILDNK